MLAPVRSPWWIAVAVLVTVAALVSCGGTSIQGTVPATGGELCTSDRVFCVEIPPQAIAETQTFRIIAPSNDRPGGQLSEVWDVEVVGQREFRFLKPAIIRIKTSAVDSTNVQNETLLRIYGLKDSAWEVLGSFFSDRVRGEYRGSVSILSSGDKARSAFTVLRVDRLPDGGIPMETDSGALPDAGVIVIPPVPDAGRRDSGLMEPLDAGRMEPDAGMMPRDSGMPTRDAGPPDSGPPAVDAGGTDSGVHTVDAGRDAGSPVDAGADAGPNMGVDAGLDAGHDGDAGGEGDGGADSDSGVADGGDGG
jgi:hypothetical protein